MASSGLLEVRCLVVVVFLDELHYLSTEVGTASLGDIEFVDLGNRRDLVYCPRDHRGDFGGVEVGVYVIGCVEVVVGAFGVEVYGRNGVNCKDSSHST